MQPERRAEAVWPWSAAVRSEHRVTMKSRLSRQSKGHGNGRNREPLCAGSTLSPPAVTSRCHRPPARPESRCTARGAQLQPGCSACGGGGSSNGGFWGGEAAASSPLKKLSQAGGANPRGQSHRLTNFCLVALRFRRGFREAKRFRLLRGAGTAFGCSSRGPSGRAQQRSRRVSSSGALQTARSGSPARGPAEFAFVSTCRSNSGFSFTVALQLHLLCFSVPFNPER